MASASVQNSRGGVGRANASIARRDTGLTNASLRGNPSFDETVTLGTLRAPVAQLTSNEVRRRMWHFAPGFLAIAGACVPHQGPAITLTVALIVSAIIAGLACYSQQMFRRSKETHCRAAIVGYAIAVVPLFLFFPSRPEPALAVAAIMAFGDGSATLVGLLAGERKLPWNRKKSWVGSAAYILVALPLATWIYWLGSAPHVSSELALLCVGPAVLGSALIESLPLPGNDNLYVGPSLAAIMFATHAMYVGWW